MSLTGDQHDKKKTPQDTTNPPDNSDHAIRLSPSSCANPSFQVLPRSLPRSETYLRALASLMLLLSSQIACLSCEPRLDQMFGVPTPVEHCVKISRSPVEERYTAGILTLVADESNSPRDPPPRSLNVSSLPLQRFSPVPSIECFHASRRGSTVCRDHGHRYCCQSRGRC